MSKKEHHIENDPLENETEATLNDANNHVEDKEMTNNVEQETLSEADQLKNELEKEKDKFLRLFAEFENFKRRTGKERMEHFKTANQEVLHSLLPVLDDFDRALAEIGKSGDKDLLKGVELIYSKLKETLKQKGLQLLEVKPGDTFDADLHDAITQVPAPDKKLKGKIVDVVEKGYTLGDRIIRYPKVVTGK